MVKNKNKAKGCIIVGIILVVAAGGILAWVFLRNDDTATSDSSNNNNSNSNNNNNGGLFGTGWFGGNQNQSQSNTNTNNAPTPTEVVPTAAPSIMPSDSYDYNRYPFDQCSPNATVCCNGLENLCYWPVNHVLFAGVHNAMATADTFVFPNHQRPFAQALRAGYRAINLDVCNCNNGVYQLCHGMCGLGNADVTDAFQSIVDFLNDNPTDVLVVMLELNSNAGQPVDLNVLYETLLAPINGLVEYLYRHDGDNNDRNDPWPTLGQLIEDGTRLLLFHFNGPTCAEANECPPGFHYYFEYAQENNFNFASVDDITGDVNKSCSVTRGTTAAAFVGVNNFITSATLTSIDDQLEHAAILNSYDFAKERIRDCTAIIQKDSYTAGDDDINFFYVDFWSVGDIVQVVQEYNRDLGLA